MQNSRPSDSSLGAPSRPRHRRSVGSRTRVARLVVGIGVVLATVAAGGSVVVAGPGPCWVPPVTGVVVDPFREPPCTWCAGNRGIEYRVADSAPVRSVASGRIIFSGIVVGDRYVVVRLASGWRLTYGRLRSSSRAVGDVVVAGSTIGVASGSFYFGLRIGTEYSDPAPHLGELVGRPRLVPTDGSARRPAPAAKARCPTDAGHR